MKKIFSFILIGLFGISAASALVKTKMMIPVQDTIIGFFEFEQLKTEPYNVWFEPEYSNYKVDTKTLDQITSGMLEEVEIIIVIGTWCEDSQRETPRFIKILEHFELDRNQVIAIGVNRKKQAEGTPVSELDIKFVPTIIFIRNGIEIGRIVESPKDTIEKDMLAIIAQK